jgi:hypothetical protein
MITYASKLSIYQCDDYYSIPRLIIRDENGREIF